jgi:diguanylate cyclase (GGDEF)-like protein
MPVTFYSCGGIDSGMPLYILAGLFMIVITLEGKQRIACFIISLLTNMCAIGISYNSMEGTKAKTLINNKILPRLTLEDRIIDMECSILLVSLFLGLTTFLVLNAYQKERTKKEELLQKVNEISKRDALTGAYNRRELYNYFDKINNGEFGTDFKNSFYIAMMDIDYFKKINDTYGHIFGDKALIKISGLLKDECKENEIVVRYGGEEFVLLFLAADNKEAFNRIDNIRQKVMDCKWKKYPDLSITISGGISKNSDFDNFENALNSADELLYKAKNKGRNMVLGL